MNKKCNKQFTYLGLQIRRARAARGMTQAELAEKADLAPNYIGILERGSGKPALNTLVNIAEILGVNFDYLMGGLPNRVKNSECAAYEKQLMEIVATFNKQQLLCLLDAAELIQKYSRGDNEIHV